MARRRRRPRSSAAIAPPSRNYATEKPVADAIYRIYAEQYTYDRTPLEPAYRENRRRVGAWRHEIVTIAPAYGGERLPIHLFLPKNVKPPFQTVLYFPGSGAIRTASSATSAGPNCVDFVLMSGRAVAFPIYKYTFERSDPESHVVVAGRRRAPTRPGFSRWSWMRGGRSTTSTRARYRRQPVAYFGNSWGARLGPITIALDSRIVGVLLMGGLGSSGAGARSRTRSTSLPRCGCRS